MYIQFELVDLKLL